MLKKIYNCGDRTCGAIDCVCCHHEIAFDNSDDDIDFEAYLEDLADQKREECLWK